MEKQLNSSCPSQPLGNHLAIYPVWAVEQLSCSNLNNNFRIFNLPSSCLHLGSYSLDFRTYQEFIIAKIPTFALSTIYNPAADLKLVYWLHIIVCVSTSKGENPGDFSTKSMCVCSYRCSLMGFDLNRHWQDPSPWAHPTLHAVKQLIVQMNQDPVSMFSPTHTSLILRPVFLDYTSVCWSQEQFSVSLLGSACF